MGYIAPKVKFDGDKFDGHKSGEAGYEFAQIPNRLLAYVMRSIPGNCGNRLKLMIFLMGCGEGFEIHEKTILKRTGMSQSAYSEARNWLDENYFITYKKGCKDASIKVNYAMMWSDIRDEELEEALSNKEKEGEPEATRESVVIGPQVWTWKKFNMLKGTDYFKSQGLNEHFIETQLKEYLSAPAEE